MKETSQRLGGVYGRERERWRVDPPLGQIRTLPLRGERAFANYTSGMFSNLLEGAIGDSISVYLEHSLGSHHNSVSERRLPSTQYHHTC